MLQFIVLGQIPGTSVQINFGLYLLGVALLASLLCLGMSIRQRQHQQQLKRLRQDMIDRTAL